MTDAKELSEEEVEAIQRHYRDENYLHPMVRDVVRLCASHAALTERLKDKHATIDAQLREAGSLTDTITDLERRLNAYQSLIYEEMAENVKLFQSLDIMKEVEVAEKCSASLVVEGIERLKERLKACEEGRDGYRERLEAWHVANETTVSSIRQLLMVPNDATADEFFNIFMQVFHKWNEHSQLTTDLAACRRERETWKLRVDAAADVVGSLKAERDKLKAALINMIAWVEPHKLPPSEVPACVLDAQAALTETQGEPIQ